MINIMKKRCLCFVVCSLWFAVFLTGCAAIYTIEPGGKKYSKGYVVKRNDVIIPEFTVDVKGLAPKDESIAKERFKRRKKNILYYYKRMGYFGSTLWESAKAIASLPWAPFRAISEGIKYHKYEHDGEYRAKIDAQDEEEEKEEQERIQAITDEMQKYIEQDLEVEKTKE